MSHCFSFKGTAIKFVKSLHLEDGTITGELGGVITLHHVPLLGQLLGGKNTEKGIFGGQPLVLGVPLPKVPLHEFTYGTN
jgi:hypothetical protein